VSIEVNNCAAAGCSALVSRYCIGKIEPVMSGTALPVQTAGGLGPATPQSGMRAAKAQRARAVASDRARKSRPGERGASYMSDLSCYKLFC
jgi:hypothetical protein